MKKFLAVYTGTKESMNHKWGGLSEDERQKRAQQGKAAWGEWVQRNQKSIIDNGSPLGKTKKADAGGISDTVNHLTAYTIVQAESHADAVKLFANHPHFTIFPGESVEVMEFIPIP